MVCNRCRCGMTTREARNCPIPGTTFYMERRLMCLCPGCQSGFTISITPTKAEQRARERHAKRSERYMDELLAEAARIKAPQRRFHTARRLLA